MKEVNIISKVVGRSGADASPSSAILPNMSGYATKTELNTLRAEFNDFLEGDDADVVINKWQDLVSFLEGISEDFDLLSMLGLKADKSELSNYVTIATEQPISAHKNFLDGLSIGGLPISKSQDDVIYLDANLVVRGGITMFGTNSVNVPTIMDAIATDGVNLKVVDGVLTFVGSSGGGLSEVYWDDVIGKPTLLSSFIDDVGYLTKSGGQMSGNIGYNLDRDVYDVGVPAAGVFYYNTDITTSGALFNKKSFIGSCFNETSKDWWHIISVRHRNGEGDGNSYGMCLTCSLTRDDSLAWNRQRGDFWDGERVILDSVNWSQFVTAADGGSYLPLSGGSLSNGINSQVLNVSSTITTAEWLSPITAYAPNLQSGGHVNIQVGVESSPRNLAWMGLRYSGYGSSANMLSLGLYGVDDALVINGNGYVGINNISPDYQLHIISDYHQVARFQSNTQSEASIAFRNSTGLSYVSGMMNSSYFVWSEQSNTYVIQIDSSGNGLFSGGITMYSDQRKKTILNHVELSLQQIADAPLIEHYYNSDEKRTTHVGSIAQYWAGLNDWFCKKDSEGFYTMEIQNAALASAISIARELVKYESKTDRKIRLLKQRVKELEDKIEKLENN